MSENVEKREPSVEEMVLIPITPEEMMEHFDGMRKELGLSDAPGINGGCFECDAIRRLIRLAPLYEALEKTAEHIVVLRHGGGKWPSVGRESLQQIYDALAAIEAEKGKP